MILARRLGLQTLAAAAATVAITATSAVPATADSPLPFSINATASAQGITLIADTPTGSLGSPAAIVATPAVNADVSSVPIVHARASMIELPAVVDAVGIPVVESVTGPLGQMPYQVDVSTSSADQSASTPGSQVHEAGGHLVEATRAEATVAPDLSLFARAAIASIQPLADQADGVAVDSSQSEVNGRVEGASYVLEATNITTGFSLLQAGAEALTIDRMRSAVRIVATADGVETEAELAVTGVRAGGEVILDGTADTLAELNAVAAQITAALADLGGEASFGAPPQASSGPLEGVGRAHGLYLQLTPDDPTTSRPSDHKLFVMTGGVHVHLGRGVTFGAPELGDVVTAPEPAAPAATVTTVPITSGPVIASGQVTTPTPPAPAVAAESSPDDATNLAAAPAMIQIPLGGGLGTTQHLAILTIWALLALHALSLVQNRGATDG